MVCLPENIHLDAYGRANPAPTLANCGHSFFIMWEGAFFAPSVFLLYSNSKTNVVFQPFVPARNRLILPFESFMI